ncbi:MAG: hypothetical protein NVS1B4_09240 [Gemmatimonadaceae bacterium]
MSRHYEYEDEPYVVVQRGDSGNGIASFLGGLAIGAGLALLFAPRSGDETRRELRRSVRRVRRAAVGAVEGVSEAVAGSVTGARDRVEERIDEARRAIDFKKDQLARAVDAGRAAAQQAREDLEKRIAETKAAYRAGGDVVREGRRPPRNGEGPAKGA